MQRIIEQNCDSIRMVVTTDRYGKKHGGFIKQAKDNYARSGFKFLLYLGYSFATCFVVLRTKQLARKIIGRPSREKTVAAFCAELGIPHICAADINAEEVRKRLANENIDLITMFYFDQIVHDDIISLPKYGVINFHPAVLPECRGLFPVIFFAVENSCQFGITAHDVPDKDIDTGNILQQVSVETGGETSILAVERLVNLAGANLCYNTIRNLESYRSQACQQNESAARYHSYPTRAQIREPGAMGVSDCGDAGILAITENHV